MTTQRAIANFSRHDSSTMMKIATLAGLVREYELLQR